MLTASLAASSLSSAKISPLFPLLARLLAYTLQSLDVSWWLRFVYHRLYDVQPATRALVRVLDARHFAKDSYHFASDQQEKTIQRSFQRAWQLLHNVDVILLDGHPDIDAGILVNDAPKNAIRPRHGKQEPHLRMLSIRNCPAHLPNTFFAAPGLQGLLYLDVSGVPGSVWPLIQPSLLPDLRVLKVRDREVDDETLEALAGLYQLRLWSLDLSGNHLTDESIDALRRSCFAASDLRSAAHFPVEGRLSSPAHGTLRHGPFTSIEESEWSRSFSHPNRYFGDSPMYVAELDSDVVSYRTVRADGLGPMRDDSADTAVRALSLDDITSQKFSEGGQTCQGLTHLHLSRNQISAAGVEKLLRATNGQLEHLSCDYMPLIPPSKTPIRIWPRTASLYGILGAEHVFRPVFSSNLCSLRIHHSLVTRVPTLELDGLSTLARIYLAETAILSRVDQAYPGGFVPDMNPRLRSLTLTCIPRRSTGPLISRLVDFLRKLSDQERAIQDVISAAASSRHAPAILPGLRRVRLEFEPDAMEEGFSTAEDLDAQELMTSGEQGFSFFEDERRERRVSAAKSSALSASEEAGVNSSAGKPTPSSAPHHLAGSHRDNGELVIYDGQWNGAGFTAPVWIGKPTGNANPTIDAYHSLIVDHHLDDDSVAPASPPQVAAGAPEGSLLFQTAWCAAVMPQELDPPSTHGDLAGMQDVLEALKRYRSAGRSKFNQLREAAGGSVPLGAPHYFWTGHLEVSTEGTIPHARSASYWR